MAVKNGLIKRSVIPVISEFLPDKIVLLSDPRQVGKTYLSKLLTKKYQYFNFDRDEDRQMILKKQWIRNGELIIFDEIHKMKNWKQWIKGVYDTEKGLFRVRSSPSKLRQTTFECRQSNG